MNEASVVPWLKWYIHSKGVNYWLNYTVVWPFSTCLHSFLRHKMITIASAPSGLLLEAGEHEHIGKLMSTPDIITLRWPRSYRAGCVKMYLWLCCRKSLNKSFRLNGILQHFQPSTWWYISLPSSSSHVSAFDLMNKALYFSFTVAFSWMNLAIYFNHLLSYWFLHPHPSIDKISLPQIDFGFMSDCWYDL